MGALSALAHFTDVPPRQTAPAVRFSDGSGSSRPRPQPIEPEVLAGSGSPLPGPAVASPPGQDPVGVSEDTPFPSAVDRAPSWRDLLPGLSDVKGSLMGVFLRFDVALFYELTEA